MADRAPTIFDVIASGRWRRATFTTFTISLTYFECYILPRLRAQGCTQIDLYVDVLGYKDSLVEQRSRYAGREYSVHPVAVQGGIFHSKIIHLQADSGDGDVLLVGSGNLTYAGHGGNSETFEALRPDLHATAFGQAGDFFADLPRSFKRVRVIGDARPLEAVAKRLTELSERFPNVQDVQFLHCLRESGLDQLVRLQGGIVCQEMLVCSPYHHPEGAPVRSLADACLPSRLIVSQGRHAETSPFPFHLSGQWPYDTRAAYLDEEGGRFVHAKWFEWRTGTEVTTFTGSFNATHESLATINNVECGVLRRASKPALTWVEDEPLPFAQQTFPRIGATGDLVVTGSLIGRKLQGVVFGGSQSLPGEWQLKLTSEDLPPMDPVIVVVAEDGTFEGSLDARINTEVDASIQVRMVQGDRIARGWITLPQILKMGAQHRSLLSALADVRTGAESAAGFSQVLAILMEEVSSFTSSVTQNLNPGVGRAESQPKSGAGSHDGVAGAVEPVGAARDAVTDRPDGQRMSDSDRLLAALAGGVAGLPLADQIAKVLIGHAGLFGDQRKAPPDAPSRSAGARVPEHPIVRVTLDDEEEAAEADASDQAKDMLLGLLARFTDVVASCRASLLLMIRRAGERPKGEVQDDPARVQALAQLRASLFQLERTWLHVMLRAYTGPLQHVGMAVTLLGEWLHRVVDIDFGTPAPQEVLYEVAGCAAVLAYHNSAGPDALMQCVAQSRPPAKSMRAIQYLELAACAAPDQAQVMRDASDWLDSQVGFELVDRAPQRALKVFEEALVAPTPRKLVALYLNDPQARTVREHWVQCNDKMMTRLRAAVATGSSIDVRNLQGCPSCRRDLRFPMAGRDEKQPDPTMFAELKVFCVSECLHCRTPLINHTVSWNK